MAYSRKIKSLETQIDLWQVFLLVDSFMFLKLQSSLALSSLICERRGSWGGGKVITDNHLSLFLEKP